MSHPIAHLPPPRARYSNRTVLKPVLKPDTEPPMNRSLLLGGTLAALLGLGCSTAAPDPSIKDPITDDAGKEDRWNWRNAPERFDGEFNYHVEDLPLEGRAERDSWPSTYWPTYEDGINARWQSNELSPAEKYDLAFNGWELPEGFMELRPFDRYRPDPESGWDPAYYEQLGPLASHTSQNMGNRRDREAAVADEEDHRPDEWPVETWWGLCHAWVPAALLEDRPLRAVEYGGVTFEVGDMEALLIAAYNRSSADMIGGRCNAGSGDSEVERDEHGRAVDVDCRDSNAGSLHVIVTNYLGMMNRGFAFDRTYDYEVWNQPVVGYEITKQEEIDVARANELLGRTGETYEYNEDAVTLYDVNLSVDWVTESHASTTPNDSARYTRTDRYTYILEVDAEGKVIGGEYYGNSREQHPDFLWNPRRITRSSVPYLDIDRVRMLIEMSRAPEQPDPVTGGELVAEGAGGIAIPDNDDAGITSAANVMGEGAVTGVRVALDITHTYVGDLRVALRKGDVERVVLNREGGGNDDIAETFDVTGFEGADPNGDWTLHVSDHAGRDTGTLNGWTLTVITDEAAEPVDPEPMPAEVVRAEGEGGVAIPDDDEAGITATAEVPAGASGTVSIELDITHSWRGDLEVRVSHGEQSFVLHDREGGSAENLSGSFPLDATGNAFEGDPVGTWTLHVADRAGADTGTLNSWAVVVTP